MTAILSSLIALAVGYVALQQFLLAKEKFKLDLFEKRLTTYKAVQAYLEEVRKTQDASDALLQTLRESTNTAKFLFESDIPIFIDTIYALGVKLNLAKRQACCTTEAQIATCKKLEKEALLEFMAHHVQFDFRFLPYLKFRKWSGAFWIDFGNQSKIELHKNELEYQTFRKALKEI